MNLQSYFLNDEEDELHRCPNADITACEFCKLLNTLSILSRNFKLRNMPEMVEIIGQISSEVNGLRRTADHLKLHVHRFDFENIKANGYRTVLVLLNCGVTKCYYLATEINDISRIFSIDTHRTIYEKLIDWNRIFRVLLVIMVCLIDFVDCSKNSCLFSESKEALLKLISMSKERVNIIGFHGRLLGFQYCKSVRAPLRLISTIMATYSEIYKSNSFFMSSIFSSQRFVYYWRNPNSRAEQIAKVCEEDPLTFFKEFWLVQERGLAKIVSNCLGEPVEANLEISIPPLKLKVETNQGKKLTILPPSSYIGIKPINLRLVSHKVRSGSVCSGNNKATSDFSKSLIFHVHGGGFVAQSSNSHLIYLKTWAKGIGAPIICLDYSLAPEAPYPRALHEAFYAYVWALQNSHILGSTAERVIFAGDSAGGLILAGLTICCIELGLKIPDGQLLVYAPLLLESAVSPSRILSLADPLIPFPALAACLGAYLGKTFDPAIANVPQCFIEEPLNLDEESNEEVCCRKFLTLQLEELADVSVPDDYHLSPLIANDKIIKMFPPTAIVTTMFDPCQDDCIEFAKRLRENDVPVTLDILNSLPHGFLNFGKRISEECHIGIETCYRRLKEFAT